MTEADQRLVWIGCRTGGLGRWHGDQAPSHGERGNGDGEPSSQHYSHSLPLSADFVGRGYASGFWDLSKSR